MARSRVLTLALVLALVVTALYVWLRAGDSRGTVAHAEEVVVSRRTFATTVVAIGAVKPQIGAEVRVGSRISGRVRRLGANIGDVVPQGAVIAELETEELDALIAERRAELRLAEARLAAFGTLAPDEEARAEAARDRRRVAEAQLESARRALDLVRTNNAERRTQAEAEVERARAALEGAQVDRSFTVLRAPIAGVVASVATQEGETVAAGLSAPTFVTIVDLDRLQVDAYVDEVDIGRIQVGQRALFTVDAFPARDFSGRVAAIYPTATIQDNVVKYVVALDIDDDYRGLLRPEMTAHVRIELESRDVLAVPSRAIQQPAGQPIVYVIENGRAVARMIRVGWRDGPWAEVTEGLTGGERVLVDGPAGEGQR